MGNGLCCLCNWDKKKEVTKTSLCILKAPLATTEEFIEEAAMNHDVSDAQLVDMEVDEASTPISYNCIEPPTTSLSFSPSNVRRVRKYNEVTIKTIRFVLPEGYSTTNIEYLGGGSYGNVIKTTSLCQDGQYREVAIKKMKHAFADAFQARRIYREIKLLQLMKHDNVLEALDLYTPDPDEENFNDIYMVTEYAGNSIAQILRIQNLNNSVILTQEHVQFIIYQILRALKYIHSANIIHRDLKPGNLALSSETDLKVLDFGLARSLDGNDTNLTQYVMTRWYRSPEVIYWNIDNYNTKADIWSVGCIAVELMTGRPLFDGEDSNSQYDKITRIVGSPDNCLLQKIEEKNSPAMRRVIESYEHHERVDFSKYFSKFSTEFIDFIDKILVLDPEKRLTVEEALKHPYMQAYYMPGDEPTADWVLKDDEKKTIKEWKKNIWLEIENFTPRFYSPTFVYTEESEPANLQ